MKTLALSVMALVLIAGSGRTALAHLDSLGAPDPYWQAGTVSTTGADLANGRAGGGSAAATVARFWKGCAYAAGGLALLLLLSLLRTLRASKQRTWE